jgi:hypothetical protein
MMPRRIHFYVLAVGTAVLSGCSGTTEPGNNPSLTLDNVLAETNSTQLFSTSGMAAGAGLFLPVPTTLAPPPSNCPFNTSSNTFVCPSRTFSGLTSTMYFQLLDQSNQPLSEFNPSTVAAIRTVTDMSGTLGSGSNLPVSINLTRHAEQTLSGLQTDHHTLNGTATTNYSGSIATASGTSTMNMTSKETTTDLVLPPRDGTNHWPLSGSISMEMTSGSGPTAFTSSTTMTFNGTSKVTITSNFGGGTRTCALDLSAPTPLGCL